MVVNPLYFGTYFLNIKFKPDPKLQFPERYLPSAQDMFLEEFQSFMRKSLPEPKDKKIALFLNWGNPVVNKQAKEAVMEIGVSVSHSFGTYENVPFLDLTLVLDKSGSMEGYDRLAALKKSVDGFIDNLRPEDNVSFLIFSLINVGS